MILVASADANCVGRGVDAFDISDAGELGRVGARCGGHCHGRDSGRKKDFHFEFLSLFRVAARSLAQSWELLCDGMWLRSANGIMSNGLNKPFGSPEERVVYVNARFRRGRRVRRSSGGQKLYQSRQVDRPSPPRGSEHGGNPEQRVGGRLAER